MDNTEQRFDKLVEDALQAHFAGWDFSYLHGRMTSDSLPWDYLAEVRRLIPNAASLLDMGTGGGEVLASLAPLPARTCATEAYAPNVLVARKQLAPLGVTVFDITANLEGHHLPFADGEFDLIINRHGSFRPSEAWRVLSEDGHFVTQQVGGRNDLDLRQWMGEVGAGRFESWTFDRAVAELRLAGFAILDQSEAFPECVFADIGAVVYYLKAVPWIIEGFDAGQRRGQLLALHRHIEEHDGLTVRNHRFFVHAMRVSS